MEFLLLVDDLGSTASDDGFGSVAGILLEVLFDDPLLFVFNELVDELSGVTKPL